MIRLNPDMQIRPDLCTPENQTHLQALTSRTQEAFPEFFPTEAHVVQYINNFREPKLALLFLNSGNYYNAAVANTNPPFNTLVMFLSVAEKLASVETSGVVDWVDFYDWVNQKDVDAEYKQVLRKGLFKDFAALMDSLKGKWSKEYGGLVKATNFLRAAMTVEEKIVLVKSVKYMAPAALDSEKKQAAALPACFDLKQHQKCLGPAGYCTANTQCPLPEDEAKLDKCLKETVKTIYELREKNLHDLQMPPTGENTLFGVQFRGKTAVAEFHADELKPVLGDLIKRFFDKYQITAAKKTKKGIFGF